MPSAPSRTSSAAASRKAGSSPSARRRTTRSGEAPGTTLESTGNGQVVPLPMSPGMRGNRASSIRMPTRAPYSALPPWAMRDGSLVAASLKRKRGAARRTPSAPPWWPRLVDQPVELAGVLAGHLVDHLGRQMAELVVDVLLRLRPHPVRMREVRAPHQRLDAHVLDQLGADAVVLEGRAALVAPVLARQLLQLEVLVLILVLEIHAVDDVGNPADAAFAEDDADVREALEHRRAHQVGQDRRQRHLEAAQPAIGHQPGDLRLQLVS